MVYEESCGGGTGSAAKSVLALLCAAQFVCWIVVPVLTQDCPPLDVVENTIWGTERIIGSYKNPALSSWLLEAARVLTGATGWPAYVLSQLSICTAFLAVFMLGRTSMGDARAVSGTLLLTACYYFGVHSPEFNQDIIEIPLWAIVQLALWRAAGSGSVVWWAILGLAGAASLYGKLSAIALLAAALLWLLTDARARRNLLTPGPWIAVTVFAICVLPLTLWLAHGALATIQDYAIRRGETHSFNSFAWVLAQGTMVLPMALLMWTSGVANSLRSAALNAYSRGDDQEAALRRYMIFMTAVPLAATVVLTLAKGTGAKLMWGVPMLNLSGLILVSAFTRCIGTNGLTKLATLSISLIVLVSTGSAARDYFGPRFSHVISRSNWPQKDIAARMRQIWQQAASQPLKIVAGDSTNWSAGLVALSSIEPIPSVFTAANPKFSPWITPERLSREGALVVWVEDGSGPPNELKSLIGARETRKEYFPIRPPSLGIGITLGYAIVLPGPSN